MACDNLSHVPKDIVHLTYECARHSPPPSSATELGSGLSQMLNVLSWHSLTSRKATAGCVASEQNRSSSLGSWLPKTALAQEIDKEMALRGAEQCKNPVPKGLRDRNIYIGP